MGNLQAAIGAESMIPVRLCAGAHPQNFLAQVQIARATIKHLVKGKIDLLPANSVITGDNFGCFAMRLGKFGDFTSGHSLAGIACTKALHFCHQLPHRIKLLKRKLGHHDATPRQLDDQPLRFELQQGFANGRAGNVELQHQPLFIDRIAWQQVAVSDFCLHDLIDAFARFHRCTVLSA